MFQFVNTDFIKINIDFNFLDIAMKFYQKGEAAFHNNVASGAGLKKVRLVYEFADIVAADMWCAAAPGELQAVLDQLPLRNARL